MPRITLPDGSQREYEKPLTLLAIAEDIGSGLAKATLAGRVDGQIVDVSTLVEHDAAIVLLTSKDDEGVEVLRHSTAHLLAQAVKQLFPNVQVTIGPVIDHGFYYDFNYEPGFSAED